MTLDNNIDTLDTIEDAEEQVVQQGNIRLDTFVSESFQISRTKAASLIEAGLVKVNGKSEKKSYILADNDRVNVTFPAYKEANIIPENIPLDIIFEDSDLLVVNKPQGMVVHPAVGNMSGTLVNALMYHVKDLSGINGILRPGIVHRIDKNTSGLLIVAKNDVSHISLAEQIKEHSFDRFYEAVVHGTPKQEEGRISFSIGRSRTDRKKMAAFDESSTLPGVRKAATNYKIIESFGKYSYLKLRLETGRTHQIRVHMKAVGHPVVGDVIYGSEKMQNLGLSGQCLHAKSIGFVHPRSGEHLYFESELPDYFSKTLARIKEEF